MPTMPSMPTGRNRKTPSKLIKNESGGGAGLLTMVLVIISLVLFTLNVGEGGEGFLTSVGGVAQTIVSPLRMAGAAILSPFVGVGNVVRNLTADEKSLTDLEDEIERLSARNVELEEAEVTARQLQELLDLRSAYNLQSTAAHVIAGATDSWVSSVTLDKGKGAGIEVGMPVTDSAGAVGQVMDSFATTSTVRLITDEGSSIAAMIQSTRAQGMLKGSPDGTLYLSFIRTDQAVEVGDIVVTSGLGGVFPKGLPIGKVSVVDSTPGSTYYSIVVEPYAHVENLEEVLVITSLTKEQRATAEDLQQSDAADMDAASGSAKTVEKQEDKETVDKTDADDAKTTDGYASNDDRYKVDDTTAASDEDDSETLEYESPHSTYGGGE
ncbi:MAG: rod shape-determining protein MreC [Coriobacteriales bacterium]|nr:rod shape-determining protein MreC [Coriobacteriales bacterium]